MSDYKEQEKTLQDTLDKVKTYGKCAIIRPTGFGKTFILTELIKHYKKVLYLYPAAVIRDTVVNRYYDSMYDDVTEDYIDEENNIIDPETIDNYIAMKTIENVTLMTYAKLIRITDDEFDEMDYDLILFDEMHRIGGPKTKIAVSSLFARNPDAHFVGATATPTRMDNFDVVSVFFSDIMVYSYTLFDAIESGMIKKPNYCYCTYDIDTDLKEAALTAGEDPEDPVVKECISSNLIEIAKIYNMPNIIRDTCEQYAVNTSYMKFIAFFRSFSHMNETLDEIKSWFNEAYPDHSVSILKISSQSSEEKNNVNKLNNLTPIENHIDIIACIDMINMGYHVDNLTGIIMYRGTKSNTIFVQQLGRALSAGANNSAIVFDVVDNLHRKAIYELKSSLTVNKITKAKKSKKKNKTTCFHLDEDTLDIYTVDSQGKKHKSPYHINDDTGEIFDNKGNKSTLVWSQETNEIYDMGTDVNKDCNVITKNCLTAVGHIATYRELIAKAVAEPMTQRCKFALELHFRTWCQIHNIEYPISDSNLQKLYGLTKEDFYKEFGEIIRKNNIAYPLQDAKSLLSIGEEDSTDVPLRICAKARNVSIAQILDVFGLSA